MIVDIVPNVVHDYRMIAKVMYYNVGAAKVVERLESIMPFYGEILRTNAPHAMERGG